MTAAPYYLIEAPESPRWLRVRPATNGNERSADLVWTNDASEAMRFARPVDAEAFCYLHPEVAFMAKVTEHLDIAARTESKP